MSQFYDTNTLWCYGKVAVNGNKNLRPPHLNIFCQFWGKNSKHCPLTYIFFFTPCYAGFQPDLDTFLTIPLSYCSSAYPPSCACDGIFFARQ